MGAIIRIHKKCIEKSVAENFAHNYNVLIDTGCNVGDGFMSLLLKVSIKGCKINDCASDKGKTHVLKLICKIPPPSKARQVQFNSAQLFEREVLMYNEFLPMLEKYQIEKGIEREEGFYSFPKCYHAEYNENLDEAIIVLEDLGDAGYSMCDKFQPMDYIHCRHVVETLGKFHALSLVLKKQRPEFFTKFAKLQDVMMKMFDKPEVQDMWNNYFDQAIAAFTPEEANYIEKIKKFRSNLSNELNRFLDGRKSEPYSLLAHGDCWINNFMFAKNVSTPVDLVLIDFQIARYVSPVLDLMYFIFVSTDKKLRDAHYDDLMRAYHATLSKFVQRCGEDPKVIFPYAALQDQLVEYGSFGLPMSMTLLPVVTIPANEMIDLNRAAELMNEMQITGVKTKEFQEIEKKMQTNSVKVAGRLRDVTVDIIDFKYIK